VGGESAEQVGAQHRGDHGAETAAGLAGDRAVRGIGNGAIARVHVADDLVAEVGMVAADRDGIDELAAAVTGPGIDVDDDRAGRRAGGEDLVGGFGERLAVGLAVAPHLQMAGVALDHVDARITAVGFVVVTGRDVDPQRPAGRIAERVAGEELGVDGEFVESSGQFGRPGQHGHQAKLAQHTRCAHFRFAICPDRTGN
jgi:hypothetical protein